MKKLSKQFSGELRKFAYWMACGTVGKRERILDNISREDYLIIFDEPSAFEQAFAIFVNVVELDDNGNVLNAEYAEKRAAQYLRSYLDSNYEGHLLKIGKPTCINHLFHLSMSATVNSAFLTKFCAIGIIN